MQKNLPRFMLSAGASGSGKTLLTCGLLSLLKRKGCTPVSFKCGPDYIDPLFHSRVLGTAAGNLDTFFASADLTRELMQKRAGNADIAVIEGVMGYYDGLGGISTKASAYEISTATDTPVIMIINARGMSTSLNAYVKGFLTYREDNRIRGLILNRMSPSYYPRMKQMLERECGIPVLGYVPVLKECFLESRHLGLILPDEISDLRNKIGLLADTLDKTLDVERIIDLAQRAPALQSKSAAAQETDSVFSVENTETTKSSSEYTESTHKTALLQTDFVFGSSASEVTELSSEDAESAYRTALRETDFVFSSPAARSEESSSEDMESTCKIPLGEEESAFNPSSCIGENAEHPSHPESNRKEKRYSKLRIGLAKDEAFCFIYAENLDMLRDAGAELVLFSPLHDPHLPENLDGLLLYGGYPELYAAELSGNRNMCREIDNALRQGVCCMAECGGFMYLHEWLEGTDGSFYPMVGRIPGKAWNTGRLTRFGYISLKQRKPLFGREDFDIMHAHEFHYFDSESCGDGFHAQKPLSEKNWDCIVATPTLMAGFPHFYYPSCPDLVRAFLHACEYRKE